MKDIPRFALILTLTSMIAAGSLGWIYKITLPEITAMREKEVNDALSYVLKGTEDGEVVPEKENEEILYYKGYRDDEQKQLVGYAFLTTARGYSSDIQTLVGMDTTGAITAIRVLSQKETPGLGTRCQEIRSGETEPWWQNQFKGLKASGIALDKDNGPIQSISGATITSRAITTAIEERITELSERLLNRDVP